MRQTSQKLHYQPHIQWNLPVANNHSHLKSYRH